MTPLSPLSVVEVNLIERSVRNQASRQKEKLRDKSTDSDEYPVSGISALQNLISIGGTPISDKTEAFSSGIA